MGCARTQKHEYTKGVFFNSSLFSCIYQRKPYDWQEPASLSVLQPFPPVSRSPPETDASLIPPKSSLRRGVNSGDAAAKRNNWRSVLSQRSEKTSFTGSVGWMTVPRRHATEAVINPAGGLSVLLFRVCGSSARQPVPMCIKKCILSGGGQGVEHSQSYNAWWEIWGAQA